MKALVIEKTDLFKKQSIVNKEYKIMNKQKIKCKVILGLPLTARERAIYLLLIATEQEIKEFLNKEKELCKL